MVYNSPHLKVLNKRDVIKCPAPGQANNHIQKAKRTIYEYYTIPPPGRFLTPRRRRWQAGAGSCGAVP